MLTDKTNEALERGMQEIAQALGMMTIAEFVETGKIIQVLTVLDIMRKDGIFTRPNSSISFLSKQPLLRGQQI